MSMVENMGLVTPTAGRVAPWDFVTGVADVHEAKNHNEVLSLSHLDWTVIQRRLFYTMDDVVYDTGKLMNVRATDGAQLGLVSEDYSLVQNSEAFEVLDYVTGIDLEVERAGSFAGGKVVFVEAKRPEDMSVLGDRISRYVLFVNTFDGSGAMKVILTNIRVICRNTLNAAIKGAERVVSLLHRGDLSSKIDDMRRVFTTAAIYEDAFKADAENLAKIKVSREGVNKILDVLFPYCDPVSQKRKFENTLRMRDSFMACYNEADLYDMRGNAWGVYNAMSDMIYHNRNVVRSTARTAERPMAAAIGGHPMLDVVHSMLLEGVVA